ncbi:aspartate racemase [Croceivirga lutea]|uniref:aspartate/glutamate racemase family protein n=1 Tax=Croceivirga lutea TaxID=1775167 RepID=UPI00163A8A4F|nr:amino acid racemase [Croceivirga lutea]GGG37580.1 aspartate racemase [Croceivirga lutea]
MKIIGLLGGMSWQSSKFYYQYINELIAQKFGSTHSARILMSSVNFNEIERLMMQDDWLAIGQLMAKEAKRLQDAGADCLLLGTNTIHIVSSAIEKAISIPFLHIARATGTQIVKKGISKVALLGTKFTMEKNFYTKILQNEFQLEIVIPNEVERQLLQALIFDELVQGVFSEEAKNTCIQIIKRLEKQGAQGVILGCTELPILLAEESIPILSFDTTLIHSKAAVDFALN